MRRSRRRRQRRARRASGFTPPRSREELDWPVDRLPAIPSYELSGVVAGLGPGVDGLVVGAEVWALTPFDRDGVAADYAVMPGALLAPKPTKLDHLHAATIPLPGLSAWQGLFDHGGPAEGQRVLIHGASGGSAASPSSWPCTRARR